MKGFTISAAHYQIAKDILVHRYGRRSDSHRPVSHVTEPKHTNSNMSLASNSNVQSNSENSKRVILQTADGTASGCTGKSGIVSVLFDTGSDRSYLSSRLVKRVEPEWVGTQPIAYSAFGTDHGGKSELRNLFHVNLKCVDDSYVSLFATEIPTICAPVYRPDIPLHVLHSFEELSIEADCSDGGEVQIDVLIGLDAYWKFMKAGLVSYVFQRVLWLKRVSLGGSYLAVCLIRGVTSSSVASIVVFQ